MRFHRGLRRASCFVRYADANPAKRAAREGWWARESSHRSRKPLKSFGRIAKPAADPAQIRTLSLNDDFRNCQTLRCARRTAGVCLIRPREGSMGHEFEERLLPQ